jgi:hypothetical protein
MYYINAGSPSGVCRGIKYVAVNGTDIEGGFITPDMGGSDVKEDVALG